MRQKILAEAIGTAMLLIAVIGSGIYGETLSDGNIAIALLANAVATGCMLYVIITVFGPISGAHFNPAVTLFFALRREISPSLAIAFVAAQIVGGLIGVWASHAMYDLVIFQTSTTTHRTGLAQWLSEIIATWGLLFVILGGLRARAESVPALVAFYITGAYWFTSSTSFANPAVTIARGFSDTFAGIYPGHIPVFILSQLVAVAIAYGSLQIILKQD